MSIDCCIVCFYFFFFQAEDGIRDVAVTGVQTCALPICQLRDGAATVTELAAPFDMSQPAISKHLKVLERAGLITRGREAQRRPRKLEPRPLAEATDWIERYRRIWEANFKRLDAVLEELKGKQKKAVDALIEDTKPKPRKRKLR